MIYVLSPLTIMVVGGIWVGLSRRIGRVQALMCSKVAGCAAMVALVLLFHRGASKFLVLVPVYLLRTSLMNGTYPIQVRGHASDPRVHGGGPELVSWLGTLTQ